MGMPLSVVVKAFLKHFIRTQTVVFSLKVVSKISDNIFYGLMNTGVPILAQL